MDTKELKTGHAGELDPSYSYGCWLKTEKSSLCFSR
jgi:hypothetical protein